MANVTAVEAAAAHLGRRARAELWLDDLRWHKHMFRRSRFQWTGEHVLDILTRCSGGRLDFVTVADLRLLQHYQDETRDYGVQCQTAMGEPLQQARDTLGSWQQVADVVGLTVAECTLTVSLASRTPVEQRSNPDVRRVLRQLPFSNPLIQVWELKQLCRLFDAARDMAEDTICDLLAELLPTTPAEELQRATGTLSAPPAQRVRWARLERGEPGDPRRIPQQVF